MYHPTFSDIVSVRLQQAGWFLGRAIDITPHVTALQAEGYTVFEAVRDFLTTFGGLTIEYTYEEWVETGKGRHLYTFHEHVSFDAAASADNVHPENLAHYMTTLHTPFCVIGEWQSLNTTLLLDPDGQLYSSFGPELYTYGETMPQALELMFTDARLHRVV